MPKKREFKAFQCQKKGSSAISTGRNRQGIIPLFIIHTIFIKCCSPIILSPLQKNPHFIRFFLHYDKMKQSCFGAKQALLKFIFFTGKKDA